MHTIQSAPKGIREKDARNRVKHRMTFKDETRHKREVRGIRHHPMNRYIGIFRKYERDMSRNDINKESAHIADISYLRR